MLGDGENNITVVVEVAEASGLALLNPEDRDPETASSHGTGEDSIDYQTQFDKTPAGVAKVAKRYGKPVAAIIGHVCKGIDELHEVGIDAVFGTAPGAASLDALQRDAAANVAFAAEQIVRTLNFAATVNAIGRGHSAERWRIHPMVEGFRMP